MFLLSCVPACPSRLMQLSVSFLTSSWLCELCCESGSIPIESGPEFSIRTWILEGYMKVKKKNLLILKRCSVSPENCWFLPLRLKKKSSTLWSDFSLQCGSRSGSPCFSSKWCESATSAGQLVEPPRFHCPRPFHFEHLKLLKFDFYSDPDPAS